MAQAFQLLNQASFGATEDEAQVVINLGVEEWIDRQLQLQPSLQLPHLRSLPLPQFLDLLQTDRIDVWFRNVETVAAEEIGRETVQYVSNIYKYYIAYERMMMLQKSRDRALR